LSREQIVERVRGGNRRRDEWVLEMFSASRLPKGSVVAIGGKRAYYCVVEDIVAFSVPA
jgi:hypothetical protein